MILDIYVQLAFNSLTSYFPVEAAYNNTVIYRNIGEKEPTLRADSFPHKYSPNPIPINPSILCQRHADT